MGWGNPFSGVTHAISSGISGITHGADRLIRDIPGSKKEWETGGRYAAAIPTGGLSLAKNRNQALRIAGTEAALLGGAYGLGVGGFGAAPEVAGGATGASTFGPFAGGYEGATTGGLTDFGLADPVGTAASAGTGAEGAGTVLAAEGGGGGLGGGSTVASLFRDTATGATGLGGSTAPASVTGASGLPPAAIGSGGQFPSNLGPLGDSTTWAADKVNPDMARAATTSTLGTVSKFAAKYGLPIAALSTQLLRRPGIPQEGNLSSRYDTMNAAGNADIASARAGKISKSQQAQVDTFKRDSDSALKQYMANSGQGLDSTSYLEMKGKIDLAATAMQQGFVDQLFSQGLAELGLADSAQSQLINLRMQREQNTSDALNNFMMTAGMIGVFG